MHAQNAILDELRAAPELFEGKVDIGINPSLPFFNSEGKKITVDEAMKTLRGGGIRIVPFVEKNTDVIKAYYLQKRTTPDGKTIPDPLWNTGDQVDLSPYIQSGLIPYSADELRGKTLVFNFWFIACKPCRDEIPELNELTKEFSNDDVLFLAFGLDREEAIDSFKKKLPFTYTTVPESRRLTSALDIFAFPTHVIIDPNGTVKFYQSGFGPDSLNEMKEIITTSLQAQH